jgi:hypothetical protein
LSANLCGGDPAIGAPLCPMKCIADFIGAKPISPG